VAQTPDLAHIDVRYVADLARIALSDAEAERFQRELDAVVGYVDQLQELDVDSIEPTAHAVPASNVLRDDAPGATLDTATVMRNAPDVADDVYVRVPVVIDGEQEGA